MNDTHTVLFELGTEELPLASLQSFWLDLGRSAVHGLANMGLVDSELQLSSLPRLYAARRLALEIPGVRQETKSTTAVRRGPAFKAAFDKQGKATKALLGFARSCGAEKEQIERWYAGEDCLKTDKGAWVTFEQIKPACPVQDVLPKIFEQAVKEVSLDTRMRWGESEAEFARPVRWIVLLYGDQVVPGGFMGLEFGRESCGHRFLSAKPVVIDNAESYQDRLHAAGVRVLWEDRRDFLTTEIKRIERELFQEHGAESHIVIEDITQATNWRINLDSAEWPQVVVGKFGERFLQLPEEVVKTVLEDQQRYFPLWKTGGKGLMPYFIAVSNLEDRSGRIRMGCERVVQARLQDAEFYLRQDQKRSLDERVVDLGGVVFHHKLGTQADRVRRIEALAGFVAEQIGVDKDLARRAAHLCKADLTTDMVQAFPRLQGMMGAYYARTDGENEIVCEAIAKQYWHRATWRSSQEIGPQPYFPKFGLTLALADRLDTLIGVFSVDEVPTGTRDPLGVRRAAYDTVYLILACDWQQDSSVSEIDLGNILEQAAAGYPEIIKAQKAVPSVWNYLSRRLHSNATEDGYAHDETEAVLAVPWRNPISVFQRLEAVKHFRKTSAGAALAEANKRIRNILRKSEAPDGDLDPELLREPAEQALAERVAALRPQVEKLCQERQYEQAMKQLATLAEPVAKFFDDVLVMAEEPEIRHNRLRLLRDVRELFLTIADLSRLQGAAKAA